MKRLLPALLILLLLLLPVFGCTMDELEEEAGNITDAGELAAAIAALDTGTKEATLVVVASDAHGDWVGDYYVVGTADDEINAALNALPGNGGKVLLSDGVFALIDPIVIPSGNITLEGQGGGTLIDGDGLATGENGIEVTGKDDIHLLNFSIQTDGGGGLVTYPMLIEDGSDRVLIENIHFIDSDMFGIRFQGTTMYDNHVVRNTFDHSDYGAIGVVPSAGEFAYRFHIEDNIINNSDIYAILFTAVAGGGSRYGVIANNIVTTTGGNGFYLKYLDYSDIHDNILTSLEEHGMTVIYSTYNIFSNNYIIDADHSDTGNFDGIHLDTDSDYNSVIGNYITDTHGYGIEIEGDYNSVSGNKFDNNNTGDYHDLGADNAAMILDDGGILSILNQSAVMVYPDWDTYNITGGVTTIVDWTREAWDTQNEFNLATDTFTAAKDGVYSVSTKIRFNSMLQGEYIVLYIYKNGGTYHATIEYAGVNQGMACVLSSQMLLDEGDTIQIWVRHNAAGGGLRPLVGYNSTIYTYLSIAKIS